MRRTVRYSLFIRMTNEIQQLNDPVVRSQLTDSFFRGDEICLARGTRDGHRVRRAGAADGHALAVLRLLVIERHHARLTERVVAGEEARRAVRHVVAVAAHLAPQEVVLKLVLVENQLLVGAHYRLLVPQLCNRSKVSLSII